MLYSPNKRERHDLNGKLLNMAWHLQNRQHEREILLHDNSSHGCTTSTEQAK
jgi:hypothetical protein